MAITGADCAMWSELRQRDLIPFCPKVLEIGRANWYGDVDFRAIMGTFPGNADPWTLADLYYRETLRNPERLAVDIDEAACDVVHDLNQPGLPSKIGWLIPGFLPADIVINTGTTEHIFDQRAAFESIHDCCKVGGLMVHAMPVSGWADHGFYNYHPTLIADVAAENGYDIIHWTFCDLQAGRMAQVAYRRMTDRPFRVPMQGTYRAAARL